MNVSLIDSGTLILTKKDEIIFIKKDDESLKLFDTENIEYKLNISFDKGFVNISSESDLWKVYRSNSINNINKTELHQNDIIKLGNFKCLVKEIKINSIHDDNYEEFSSMDMTAAFPSEISNYNINPNFSHSSLKKYSLNNENNIKSCRICLSEDNEKSNPLISPCHCKGTMKWIHLNCLKQCIKNKIESIEDEVTQIFSWQNLDCELCKTSFISENCKLRSISNLFQPEKKIKSFVSFLSLQHDISNKFFLFLLNLDSKEEINLGRFNDCELRINDISVSRFHAKIYKKYDSVFLEDLDSKFGSLILANKNGINLDLNKKNSISVQVDRFLLNFNTR